MNAIKLKRSLTELINEHSIDSECQTPDFILANYLLDCIASYKATYKKILSYNNVVSEERVQLGMNKTKETLPIEAFAFTESELKVLFLINQRPKITLSDIAAAVGLSTKASAQYPVKKLISTGAIKRVNRSTYNVTKHGKSVINFVNNY